MGQGREDPARAALCGAGDLQGAQELAGADRACAKGSHRPRQSTVIRGLLEKWFDIEKRKPVLETITAQLDTIKVPQQKNGDK